ncbi:hypothetical protein HPP92_016662 [Vanilla planifolia]|uniref:WD repeat-containing protein 6 n=1 Tax=Vanilla planifolia TaxID=51239 RepID=A0A835QF70_VANPL|nr:hypothetical protein HPP92_016662 [Vanilla planifolia]
MTNMDPQLEKWCFRPGPYLGEISALSFYPLPSHVSSYPLLLAGTGSELLVYNLISETLLYSFKAFDGVRVHGISLQSSADPLVALFAEKKVKLLRLSVEVQPLCVRLEITSQLPRFDQWVLEAKFLGDDGYLAVGLSDNSVALWDVGCSTVFARVKYPESCLLYSMRIWGENVDALRVASGTIYNEVIVWRLDHQVLHAPVSSLDSINKSTLLVDIDIEFKQFHPIHLTRLSGHEGSIFRIAWSYDGFKLASVSDDRSARIWMFSDNETQKQCSNENLGVHSSNTLVLFGHNARIWDCHVSDFLIITAGEDCTCRVWDMNGNMLLTFKEHTGRGIWRCLYDQNSSLLVTAGFDSAIKVHLVHCPSVTELKNDEKMLNCVNGMIENFSIEAPQITRLHDLMDSKSEYVRCLYLGQEYILYVATNNGLLYHVDLCNFESVRWFQIAQVGRDSPIICMDVILIHSCELPFSEYLVALGDGLGNATVMKLVSSKSTSRVVLSVTWTAEKERQLLGIYWSRSLRYGKCSHLFTIDPRGALKLWRVENTLTYNMEGNYANPKVSFIADFASYFGARIMCVDASASEEVLFCGDQRGNLIVYPLSDDLMNAESVEKVKTVSAINQFKGAHGISTVTSVTIAALDAYQVEICTTGGDGCICYFVYDKNLQVFEFVGMKQVKDLATVQSLYTSSNSCEYAIGFTSADFMIWNLSNGTKMLEIPCGGWRRPYSYHLGVIPECQYCFAYVKDRNIHVYRLWEPAHQRLQYPRILHIQYHGREIHTLCFISFLQQSTEGKRCDSLIATGCEDGSVRLTSLGSFWESKLLGEHVGGSAVRSICFTSKIYAIGADHDCSAIIDASHCSKDEPFLLISVGAKQVLTSWRLQNRRADATVKHVISTESGSASCSSRQKLLSVSFQWLSTHVPTKFVSPQRRVNKSYKTNELGKTSATDSDANDACISESIKKSFSSFSTDIVENDWRYLAVTAFLVKHVDCRFTTCFIVVACSDATLVLRALLLPYHLWFDVALLMPQQAPILALQHVAVPVHKNTIGINQSRVAHIVIGGSTDGSISFWDLTETVENFVRLVLEYQSHLLIDLQRRPQTGRGSQGGRWWRYLTNLRSEKEMRSASRSKFCNGSEISESSENSSPESSCMQKNNHSSDSESSSLHNQRNVSPFLVRREVLPLLVLSSVHQSGANCLHVSEMRGPLLGKSGPIFCVVSGGDDQALHILAFHFDVPVENSGLSSDYGTDLSNAIQDVALSQPSGSSWIKRCSFSNVGNDHRLRILKRQTICSAHSSSVKGIWTDGIWVFSVGLDQRIRCWKIQPNGELFERAHVVISVPEPETLDVVAYGRRYHIAVAGRGLQTIDFSAPCDEN